MVVYIKRLTRLLCTFQCTAYLAIHQITRRCHGFNSMHHKACSKLALMLRCRTVQRVFYIALAD
jgi:hypothetical protein